jgi:hypothetical protein
MGYLLNVFFNSLKQERTQGKNMECTSDSCLQRSFETFRGATSKYQVTTGLVQRHLLNIAVCIVNVQARRCYSLDKYIGCSVEFEV